MEVTESKKTEDYFYDQIWDKIEEKRILDGEIGVQERAFLDRIQPIWRLK